MAGFVFGKRPMDLKLVSDDGGVLRLEMAGRIVRDDAVSEVLAFDRVMGPDGYARKAALSLAETTFIDASRLSWLVLVHKRFQKAGGKLVVHSIRPTVMAGLEMVHFIRVLHIADDEAAAMELLRAES